MSAVKSLDRYRLRAGLHYGAGVAPASNPNAKLTLEHHKLYKPGDVVESEEDLVTKFPNKFERVSTDTSGPVPEVRVQVVEELLSAGGWEEGDRTFLERLPEPDFARIVRLTQSKQATENRKPHGKYGDDVTDDFQLAYDMGFKIYRNATGFHQVVAAGAKKPANLEPLQAGQVEKFVSDYVKEAKAAKLQ